jgi:hypothetical protein
MGLLHGRRGSKSVVTCEVVGFLCASIGRVVARYLAYRHLERTMPRKRRNAGGGITCAYWMRTAGRIHPLSGPANPTKPIAARSRMYTYSQLTGHKSLNNHYRHMSSRVRPCDVSPPERCDICRRFFEALRYGWCRRPLSHSSLRWVRRHRRMPRLATRQKQTWIPRLRRLQYPRHSRSLYRQLAAGLLIRMTRRRYPSWVR